MKYIILVLTLTFSSAVIAKSGDMGGGRSIRIKNSKVEAILSQDGDYIRLLDIKEGFAKIECVKVGKAETIINPKSCKKPKDHTILLEDGSTKAVVGEGGDMGGG